MKKNLQLVISLTPSLSFLRKQAELSTHMFLSFRQSETEEHDENM